MAKQVASADVIHEDNPNAPFIVFDAVNSASVMNGYVQITLSAKRLVKTTSRGAEAKTATSAHLRMSPLAARELAQALASCLQMIVDPPMPPQEDAGKPN